MKKVKCLALLALVLCMLFQTGCTGGGVVSKNNFLLSHYSGADSAQGYDAELLYKNKERVWGADSGIIWVSEEQSAEYGGWYYQYMSGNANINARSSTFIAEDGKKYRESIQVLRSKNLVEWEMCGVVDSGMGLMIAEDEWVWDYVWAPEVVYDQNSGKYFMYFSARCQSLTDELISKGARYKNYYNADGTRDWRSELNLGIAVADDPIGPFRLVTSENVYGDANATNPLGEVLTGINPPILFSEQYEMDAEFSAIDLHPFFDENGDFYLYFVKHQSQSSNASGDTRQSGNHIWGIKMLDMVTPDYSSITKIVSPYNYVQISYLGESQLEWDDEYPRNVDLSYEHSTTFPDGTEYAEDPTDATVTEAPQIITTKDKDGKTVYLITYSVRGVGYLDYDVHYAYSYSPLGPFTKAQQTEGNAILELDESNDYASNLGHHEFITVGNETWITYAKLPFIKDFSGRAYAIDRIGWRWGSFAQANGEALEILIPVANGPTQTVQPLVAEVSGYRNIASEAKISVSSGNGIEYLTDGVVTTTSFLSDLEFVTDEKELTITLTFDTPKTIRGIYIYNSYNYALAFNSIDFIQFELDETPDHYTKGSAKSCMIKNLAIDPWTINSEYSYMRPGGGAVATFDEIKVNSITIKISDTVDDQWAEGLAVSDIYVIGK